jgi:serine/threonine protein kinase
MTPERWKEIEKLYAASISLPPERRAEFLANSCHDPEVRQEVESLLCENLPSFLEQRGLDVAADAMPRKESGTLVGRTIDHYEVRAFIGAGGMGEVYRARDSRLARDVGLKVLPEQFSEDPEWMRRSEREAKLLALLNHPNIGTIYDLEESDGVRCLILEFVEGETLAERLRRGVVPLVEALEISGQIAEALEAAHEQGIVHRDLKPGNVMISAAGRVKVLDFGIAKMLEPQAGPSAATNVDSASAGVVLGTPSYMSPEQARGKSIDTRRLTCAMFRTCRSPVRVGQ